MGKNTYLTPDGIRICAVLHDTQYQAKGTVVLAHGIGADKDEYANNHTISAYSLLADSLNIAGYNVLRFDFRGHGESGGVQEQMTIAGEILDVEASIEYAKKRWELPIALVAASFGSVSTIIYTASNDGIPCIVLWNPVLNLRKTFIEPTTPWAKLHFNSQGFDFLEKHGYMYLDNFRLGKPLIEEMKNIDLSAHTKNILCPVLTIHGDQDTYVPFEISKKYSKFNLISRFIRIPDSEHSFGKPDDMQFVIKVTIDWIQNFLK